jgi:3-hydroxy acid dehydrogenase/malonic semialdehyde reductase|tara:strand:+ start:1494 stop:2216 length:723 start_codon:yes stop_codon:yes gene_type:complete
LNNPSNQKLVVVTGASSGIGLALVKALLAEGYAVLGIAKSFEKAGLNHPNFSGRSINLADLDGLPEAMSLLLNEIDRPIKALINNAGIGRMGFLEQLSVKDIRLVMDTNLTSQVIVTKTFLPLLKKQGEGDILFMGSEAALKGARQGSIYCASKFALRGFSQALREECGKSGVRITLINPGAVRTPFFEKLQFEPGLAAENAIEPEDIASAVSMVLAARSGTVFDEITLSPRNQVWKKKD